MSDLLRLVNRAIHDFDLITDGDRIAVGVSGGQDSRVLLDLLARGVDVPGKVEIVAVHIDGAGVGLPALVPTLEPWLRGLGVSYHIAPLEVPPGEALPMACFRCAFNRRKALFTAADALGCNKVAYGHHADDDTVTTLMSLLYKGQLESLPPRRTFFEGRFTLIRPLIYAPAADIARYARAQGWTFPPELECPRHDDSRRVRLARFLATFTKKEQTQFRANLWRISGNEKRVRRNE